MSASVRWRTIAALRRLAFRCLDLPLKNTAAKHWSSALAPTSRRTPGCGSNTRISPFSTWSLPTEWTEEPQNLPDVEELPRAPGSPLPPSENPVLRLERPRCAPRGLSISASGRSSFSKSGGEISDRKLNGYSRRGLIDHERTNVLTPVRPDIRRHLFRNAGAQCARPVNAGRTR